jgi:hypothetical protein
MKQIQNTTRDQLLEILMKEYPNKEKSFLERLVDNILSLSKMLVKRFFKGK